ncbi:hypothetical protein PA598K_02425 [Paenibacillus sp. 598K]|nr:hypothetical protein PA598K_02425 [Paenibacillus sp. 598K]
MTSWLKTSMRTALRSSWRPMALLVLVLALLTGCGLLNEPQPESSSATQTETSGAASQHGQEGAEQRADDDEGTSSESPVDREDNQQGATDEEAGGGNGAVDGASDGETSLLAEYTALADYIKSHGELPDYYLTKREARELGWDPQQGNLHEVAPGMSIGGDRFGNREGLLPDRKGRVWYEADIGYEGGHRGAERVVYSNDGLIYVTLDHYKTFEQIE